MFQMNFFVTFLCVSILRISLGIPYTTPSAREEYDRNKTLYLINAENGLRFYTTKNTDGTVSVTYDCSSGGSYEGTITLDDSQHPQFVDSVFIKNCLNITLHLYSCRRTIKTLHLTGAEELNIKTNAFKPLETVITDVKMLKWSSDRDDYGMDERSRGVHEWFSHYDYEMDERSRRMRYNGQNCYKRNQTSLNLNNVVVKDFNDNTIDSVYMTGVVVERFTSKSLSCSILNIKDSRIDYVEGRGLFGEAKQVHIVNTTFGRIHSRSFQLRINESFVFSDNHVMKTFDAFNITCPKVEIVGNTIDYAKDCPFTIQLSHPVFGENIFTSLNVSLNKMNTFQDNLVWLDENSEPDFLAIEKNYFNCACKTSIYLEELVLSNSSNIITKLFLHNDSNNVCVNFGNCPLRKLLGKESSVCRNTFVCPDDSSQVSTNYLEEILSELKNLTETLHSFKEQNGKFKYSDVTSTENYTDTNNF